MKEPSPADRRVQRTRKALREAMVALILERGWDAVGVQEVCERANVGRSTFYTHFADKEELLVGGLGDLGQALRVQARAAAGASGRPLGFVRGMIEHVGEQHRLFRAVVGKRSGQAVHQRFRELVIELVSGDLAPLAPAGPRREAAIRYVAGAFLELLVWWVDARTPLPAEELEAIFERLSAPVLAMLQAQRGGGSAR